MSVLVKKSTCVICQGFSGWQGTSHPEPAVAYEAKTGGGVTGLAQSLKTVPQQ